MFDNTTPTPVSTPSAVSPEQSWSQNFLMERLTNLMDILSIIEVDSNKEWSELNIIFTIWPTYT